MPLALSRFPLGLFWTFFTQAKFQTLVLMAFHEEKSHTEDYSNFIAFQLTFLPPISFKRYRNSLVMRHKKFKLNRYKFH